jgi:hypothetical protein
MPSSVMTTIVLRATIPASGVRWWTQWREGIRHRDGRSRAVGGSRPGHHSHEVGVILTSSASGARQRRCGSFSDATVQVMPEHTARIR